MKKEEMIEWELDLGEEIITSDNWYKIRCGCGAYLYYPKSKFPDNVVKWSCSCGNYGTQRFREDSEDEMEY